ncbi:glutathione peroxidase [Aquibacillus koreensis]|uniref:Glutathione peroxidase n=1 Tax=Aquibacillus koreensis TaxID=279446 RepID=A0A9X3WM39_9BACI|nr:glutathione peroxidase [Aquibacillus koreensis]MCT2534911.1 glutathione peroxidase [Aquibacillus koreensis]MDC3422195.1 glutathione peroxidase [Aquibacillus koreensis]
MGIYDFEVETIKGEEKSLSDYEGKAVLIVNTASKCGFTPQLEGLQALYDKYKEQGLEILGFPSNQFMNQEPGSNDDIQAFCQLNYGVTFPMFSKIDVRGKTAHPLFKYLVKQAPGFITDQVKWNFTKFLIDKDGNVVKRYAPKDEPKDIEKDIEAILNK